MSNSLVVVDSGLRAVVRVDPVKGAAIIADTDTGGGPPFIKPLAIAVEATGALVVLDEGGGLGWGRWCASTPSPASGRLCPAARNRRRKLPSKAYRRGRLVIL